MPIAATLQAPTWVNSGAEIASGLDLLGLRLPVQFIGGTLLDGVTTVTPSVRYLAFRAWLIHRCGQSGQPDRWQDFTNFAARIESALVLGNLTQDRNIGGLIGTDQALARLDANTPRVAISALVKSPASTIYAGPSDQLGITKSRDDSVPALVAERGLPLANALDRTLTRVPLIERLLSKHDLAEVGIDDLRELGAIARIDQIPDDERKLLIAAIFPHQPLNRERARIGTYAALLALAAQLKARPAESDLFDAACSMSRFGEPILDRVAGGWTSYCVRDAIAVSQEAVMAAVMDEIMASPDGGLAGVDRNAIIAGLMERVEEHDSALRDLGLLSGGESNSTLSFRGLQSRIDDLLTAGSAQSHGISRWPDTLTEPVLYRRALRSGAGALTLAVVAWLVAARRVGEGVRENGQQHSSLSYQGWRRMGLRDVILPELERFHRENRSLREAAAELAYRTVQQHLQITWSRLQVDLRRDVASFRDPGFGTDRSKEPKGDQQPAAPVNPHDLICHLEESPVALPHFGSPHAGSLSLTGILRLLFEAETDDRTDSAAAQDEQLDEGQLPHDSEKQEPKKKSGEERAAPSDDSIEARFRERLESQIDTFLKELSSPTFAERCTATQMVQAVSFPLAVALRGQRRGWVSGELAEKWALEIFSILFWGTSAGGLLHVVEKRYADSGHQSTFGDVVGDGTLWLVLVATLGNADWRGVGTDVDKALALREVFTAPQLLASAQSGRIASLLGKVRIEDAHAYSTDIAPKVSMLLNEIEGLLAPIWNAEMHDQTDRSITHKVGDLLWRENVDWAICLADTEARSGQAIKVRLRGLEKAVMVGYYVNVTELAGRHPDLARLLDQLRAATSRLLATESH